MTAFLTGGGAGVSSSPVSRETQILRDMDSRKQSFVNKDFVKNIAWLNQSVDTLSAYTQKLQAGVDSANQNALEQIQGIWGDLFILFAGLEPTGIDVGDVKFIIQGIGAFFGINPDTPFPLNLVEAAAHFLTTYIIPLPQFSDVIFDAIIAWAEDLGLSPDFIASLKELRDAIVALGASFEDLFGALKELLAAFGFLNWTSTSGLGELWDALVNLIDGLPLDALKPVLSLLSELGVPFIQALTAIVNGGTTFLGYISGNQIRTLGDDITPKISSETTVWSVGGSSTTAWVYDPAVSVPGTTAGSFTTLGTGVAKRLQTQTTFVCTPGDTFQISAQLKWAGIPSAANDFGIALVWFNGGTEISQTTLNIAAGHGSTGGFTKTNDLQVTVPQNVNGFKIAARVGASITTGQVWADAIVVQRYGTISQGMIDGLEKALRNFLGFVHLSQIIADNPNMLPAPSFPAGSIAPNDQGWSVDTTSSRTDDSSGSAMVVADGKPKALRSGATPLDRIPVVAGQKFSAKTYVSHVGYVGTGETVFLQLVPYMNDVRGENVRLDSYAPPPGDLFWPGKEMSGEWEVPQGVTSVQTRIYISEGALGGTFRFDDASAGSSGKFHMDWIEGLPSALQDGMARWQLLVDTVVNSLTNGSIFGYDLEDLARALLSISPENILGLLGPGTIAETITAIVNQIVGGLVGTPGDNAGMADLFNFLKLVSSWASQGKYAWEILGKRDNTPIDSGLLPSSTSNYKINYINTTLACTQANSLIATFRIEVSAPLGVVAWLGYGSSGITAFYVNIWKINPATQNRELIHHSADIKSVLHPGTSDADIGWNFYFLPTAIPRYAEDEMYYELVPVGGTHYVRGIDTGDSIPDNPYAATKGLAATRNNTSNPNTPPASITKAAWVTAGKIPWIETAIDVVSGNNQFDPIIVPFDDDGSVAIPYWANYVDVIPVGKGGDGADGATLNFNGRPGTPGKVKATTWIRDTHFSGNSTVINFVTDNTGATFSIPGHSLTSENGSNGSGQVFNGNMVGKGPGPFTYKGETYDCGGDQKSPGGKGTKNGGAGAGGRGLILPQHGGDGGTAAGWLKFRQNPTDDEGDIFDTIPPSAPALVLVNTTFSSITVTAESPESDVAGYDFYLDGVKINETLVPVQD